MTYKICLLARGFGYVEGFLQGMNGDEIVLKNVIVGKKVNYAQLELKVSLSDILMFKRMEDVDLSQFSKEDLENLNKIKEIKNDYDIKTHLSIFYKDKIEENKEHENIEDSQEEETVESEENKNKKDEDIIVEIKNANDPKSMWASISKLTSAKTLHTKEKDLSQFLESTKAEDSKKMHKKEEKKKREEYIKKGREYDERQTLYKKKIESEMAEKQDVDHGKYDLDGKNKEKENLYENSKVVDLDKNYQSVKQLIFNIKSSFKHNKRFREKYNINESWTSFKEQAGGFNKYKKEYSTYDRHR
ncbi:hypothetical protein EHP00_425 [Ecytonucleospora hepatopenaei]|uniref:Uncharacterized protein n=1 Tax=Ecytonucleospora hepatopenaei TaxID=646526 RepID=A0A1W0E5Y8_9MICR|nr:hypothetical protein EHP00_425 [Ecytonucleospora hepatopenaei]